MLGLHMVNLKGAIIGPRGVRYVAAMGYSSGGAMTYEFTTQLKKLRDEQKLEGPFVIDFTAYIDAVMWSNRRSPFPKRGVLLQNTTLTTTKETVAPLAILPTWILEAVLHTTST
jgi:hypothetical protein